MVDAGAIALMVALVTTAYVAVASFLGAWRRSPELVLSARYGLYSVPFLLSVATLALVYAFVTKDFSVRYVAENSNLAMPSIYTWVAFYAGNGGSLLYISVVFASLVVLAVLHIRRRLPFTAPYATGLMALVLLFFLGVMVFLANPLERLPAPLQDGRGINPLLIHFGMFFHPPVQMAALVSVAIPFSIAMGALLARRGGRDEWVDAGRTWGLISWLLLAVGLMLGSWWAYTILGWGGYWAWDPVENVALMPWLAMTAFVHSVMIQKRRGMFRMWNIVLIIVAFTLAQLGMFINRGGPVPSVHSFAQSTMGWLFLFFMGFTLIASLGLFILRQNTLKSRSRLESLASRESVFLAQNVLFLAVAFVTLWGTIYPVISDAVQGVTITVGPPFYNVVNGPILLLLVLLMGVGPLLPWRQTNRRVFIRVFKYPLAAGGLAGATLLALGLRQPLAIFALALCALVLTGILHEWIRGTLTRHRRGESYPVAFMRLLLANRPRYGGYIVHIAIVMLAVGATASSYYSVQRDVALAPGDTASLGGYSVRYLGVDQRVFPDREEFTARMEVYKGSRYLGVMQGSYSNYASFQIGATRAAIRSTPLEDFYIVPSEFSDGGHGVFRFYINPLVWWMWASGPLLLLGTLLSLSPQRVPAPAAVRLAPPGRMDAGARKGHGLGEPAKAGG